MAVVDLMVERVWPVAKQIVLSWNDSASEIFVLDLPRKEFGRILDVIIDATHDPVVLRFDGINLDQERVLNQNMRDQLVRASKMSTVHSIRGSLNANSNCYFYFWVDAEKRTIETEMVFWNDLSFPPGRTLEDHKEMLGRILRIAHRIRGENHQSKCILSPEYNSEPSELLKGGHKKVAIW
ncbi:MAG: hypothetical protein OQK12_05110 [Motiliproteus sp.]|nr:hypothetical protein [Motiliproteus sp.]MCW9050990.1 hypothetical protein [Motiliproteus sp.]